MDKTRKIAIVRYVKVTSYEEMDDRSQLVMSSISDWDEVTTEEYQQLIKAIQFTNLREVEHQYRIIEHVELRGPEVTGNVRRWLKHIEQQQQAKVERAQKAAKKKEERWRVNE